MQLKSRSCTLHPYVLLLPWKYASTYFPFRHIPKLFYSYTGSEHKKSHHPLLALLLSNKAPNIPITTFINISKRGLGSLKKGEKKEEERKRTNVPT
jgi:hypothetical protein